MTKRRAKPKSKSNIPGSVAGPDQAANGPSQDQEIQISKQAEVSNASSSSSEDSETEEVEVQAEVEAPKEAKRSKVDIKKPVFEVVVTGVVRFMPIEEVRDEAGAIHARRINRRVDGKLEPTTAIVLTYDSQPPVVVNIHYESYRTKAYIRQAARCFHCQGWNHRQAGCKKQAKCARCGEIQQDERLHDEKTIPR